jgi:glucose/arabinose dehydrogenase
MCGLQKLCVCAAVIVAGLVSLPAVGCHASESVEQSKFVTHDGVRFNVEVVATQLEVPWSLAFAKGDLYFTERQGRLKVLRKNESVPRLVAKLPDVRPVGEGGLMGLAFHPSHSSNKFVYMSYTYTTRSNEVANKVVRFVLGDSSLSNPRIIIDGLPGASIHNGCRIRFGPDGKLYITTGEAGKRELAQMMNSNGGKILRVNDDGTIPKDNPFENSPIYSLGHRNGQGLDWHPQSGMLLESEHGPSGFDGPGGGDEINIIIGGKNYGWPIIHHQQKAEGMESPLLEFTPAVAPSGASFYSGKAIPEFASNFFVATLRGHHIIRVVLKAKSQSEVFASERLLEDMFGRIRDITEGPDGYLYFSTSNRDGRGNPTSEDDRILRIVPSK